MARYRPTIVKARDLKPGMVVRGHWMGPHHGYADTIVERVVRAADEVDAARAAVAKAPSRPKMLDAAVDLVELLGALVDYGREARLIWWVGQSRPVKAQSQDDYQFLRYATSADRERVA